MKLLLDYLRFSVVSVVGQATYRRPRGGGTGYRNQVYLSVVSAWEIGRKFASGSLFLDMSPEILIPRVRDESGIESLQLTEADALMAEKLPRLHKDSV